MGVTAIKRTPIFTCQALRDSLSQQGYVDGAGCLEEGRDTALPDDAQIADVVKTLGIDVGGLDELSQRVQSLTRADLVSLWGADAPEDAQRSFEVLGGKLLSMPIVLTEASSVDLSAVVAARRSVRPAWGRDLSVEALSTILANAYGITQLPDSHMPRAFRATPSAGALHPLELFVALREKVGDVPAGLRHFDVNAHALALGRELDAEAFERCFVDPGLVEGAAVVVLVVGVFSRSTSKYGARGYRFTLLEAGLVVQSIALSAQALGLHSIPVGGYVDHALDGFLGLDGVHQSVIYTAAVGGEAHAS